MLAHLREGKTNRQIAGEMFTSQSTVKALVARLLRRLDAKTRAGAVARAQELDER